MKRIRTNIKKLICNVSLLFTLGMTVASCQDDLPIPDYTRSGEAVCITLDLSLPKMDVKTRASLDEPSLNRVESLWIRTYSSVSGQPTSEWVKVTDELPTTDSEEPHPVTISTKSGPSYIVGVANVDNMGVTKDNLTQRPLSELLTEADSWEKFLNIAVCSPTNQNSLNAPEVPLPMAGCYTNLVKLGEKPHDHNLDSWQTENFISYFIPASSTGDIKLDDGAIHLRRLVSHINFNLTAGENVTITPTSYRVFNAPAYSWIYERATENGMVTNFGDLCTEADKDTYYKSPAQFSQSNITSITDNNVTTYKFDFWQAENKHRSIIDISNYAERDLQNKTSNLQPGETPPENDKYQENTGIFTNLCGASWTPNNMASYVLITCTVEYKGNLNVNNNGEVVAPGTSDSESVTRSGVGYYLIHLGYMNDNAMDFNCFRNVDYTYNVTIEGLNKIRVEAFGTPEDEYPGVEGQVADVEHTPYMLDCHYGSFNIQLTENELKAWDATTKTGFGFIVTTYENGVEHTYDESDFTDGHTPTADELKYMGWIELKPTSGENVRAIYTPRGASGSTTFNLWDASRGRLTASQKSDTNWYTVFVNEYSYEAANADESVTVNGKPLWTTYVNQNPRRFYIRVTRGISADGNSIYSRSKYAGVQQSMMTYYSTEDITVGGGTRTSGSAVAVERTNESFGLNLRRSFTNSNLSTENGRYNTKLWIENRNNLWNNVIQRTKFAYIPAGNTGNPSGNRSVARLYGYTGNFTGSNAGDNNYDPQPSATTSNLTGISDNNYYIEAINACMNRNRDNNGDGTIDNDEIRWYVPAMGKYLRLILGNASLENPLMNYQDITQLEPGSGSYEGDNAIVGRYLFFSSDGRVLWAMEGLSTSNWGQYVQCAPWEVRCIRNLGLNLRSNIESVDRTVPAYTFKSTNTVRQEGGIVTMAYYSLPSKRVNMLTANGTGAGQMPAHVVSDRTYNSLYRKFEISKGRYQNYNSSAADYNGNGSSDSLRFDINGITYGSLNDIRNYINTNPCSVLNNTTNGTGWRVPNMKELAIMRNLGLLDGLLVGGTSAFMVSATFSTFNSLGQNTFDYTGSSPALPTGSTLSNKILVSRHDGLTQTATLGGAYIRCVRDVD